MGLTPIRPWTFYWVSQVAMFPATVLYVNAGTQLARVESTAGILSPGLIGAFLLLGIFPLVAKRIIEAMGDGTGTVMLDGRMQDDATFKQAQVMVETARIIARRDPEYAKLYGP